MKIKQIDDQVVIDDAMPTIVANDMSVAVIFYAPDRISTQLSERQSSDYQEVFCLKFHLPLYHRLGGPGDETLHGHPYYKLGMGHYGHFILTFHDSMFECIARSFTAEREMSTLQAKAYKLLSELVGNRA